MGARGVITRVPPAFNWLSADGWRHFFIGARSSKSVKVPNSPHEITVLLSAPDAAGVYQPCAGTINFTLAQSPVRNAAASLYCGELQSAVFG